MPAEFNQWGLQFQYPENWSIDTDGPPEGPRSVSVHSPDSAFWSVTVAPVNAPSLAQGIVEAIRQEYETCECEPVEHPIGELRLDGFELNFYCLDFLVTALVLQSQVGGEQLAILCQAESREFERLRQVFDAISVSLLQHRPTVD